MSTDGGQEQLKVTLVVAGAIALGSFESGVVCELARAARAKDGPFTIDVIAGSSAGSITGAQVAKVLVAPLPDFSSFAMWADVTLQQLTDYAKGETSPLSQSWIRSMLKQQLEDPPPSAMPANDTGEPYEAADPAAEVRLLVTLTDLEGDVRTASFGDGINVPVKGRWNGVTVTTSLSKDTAAAGWGRVAELVQASSAHSGAWQAVGVRVPATNAGAERWDPPAMYASLLARQRTRGPVYFVDGGTVNNLPVGAALRALPRHAPDWQAQAGLPFDPHRMVLYVEPDPLVLQASAGQERTWGRTALQAVRIVSSGPVPQGELRWVGENNEAVVRMLQSVGEMGRALGAAGQPALLADESDDAWRQAAAARIGGPWGQRYADQAPALQPGAGSEAAVDELYGWLDGFAADAGEVQEALTALMEFMDRSPLGTRPRWGGNLGACMDAEQAAANVTDRVRWAVFELGFWYYQFKHEGREDLAEAMRSFHKHLARHSPAGDRSWVFVTRIVPVDEKPLSGELGHFGGFLHRPWMAYDYALGRRAAIGWLREKFPACPYVVKQLALLPALPAVTEKELAPKIWAQNAVALANIAGQVHKSAVQELPWLKSRTVRLLHQVAGIYLTGTVAWGLGSLLKLLPGGSQAFDASARFLGAHNVSATGTGFGTSAALGWLAVWWWGQNPVQRRIRLLAGLWALVRYGGRIGDTFKAVFKPGAGAGEQDKVPV